MGEILREARSKRYGVLSLLAGSLEMVLGAAMAAEELRAPLILAFNQEVTPQVPMEIAVPLMVNVAQRARVPVATILDHGQSLETIVQAIRLGLSSVMFDASGVPYEENVARTREVVRIAHAVGVSVEAELGSIAGSVRLGPQTPGGEASLTDPLAAAEYVAMTGVDALAISVGNAHGVYRGEPRIDLDRIREIHDKVDVPLVMHGASGLSDGEYPKIVASGISKLCYYTAMGIGAIEDLKRLVLDASQETIVYHQLISRAIGYFYAETKRLIGVIGWTGSDIPFRRESW
ncbi:MAG: class II fructose-bisphosphate aldolase family protein [Anaerolineales bacterium]|nr:class II fructose-bisphosphate aldolase family protein [Anaerolineales bacterium]